MKKLLVYLKGYKIECILAPFFKMVEALLELFVPLVVASIIDRGIGGNDVGYIIRMCLILAGLAVFALTGSLTAQYFSAKAAICFTSKVRKSLFGHIQSLSYTELDKIGTSTLITRMTSDMNRVQNGVNMTLRLFLRSPFIVFGAMIMAFTIDTRSAMIFVFAIVLLSIVVFGIILGCIPLYHKIQSQLDDILDIARDNLMGVRVLRAFCKEQSETDQFNRTNKKLSDSQKFAGRISALMNPVTYVIINFAVIILIHTGAVKVASGELSQGQVVALYNYMSQILIELIKLANLIITITNAVACGNRVQAVFEIKSSITPGNISEPDRSSEYIVKIKNACMRYKDASGLALENIDLSVKRGQTVGIIGGTGSGKTSLIGIICRFYDIESGEVAVNGHNVKDYNAKCLRDMIGIVPQKAVLFKGTIRENIKFGNNNASDEEIMQAIKAAQAEDIVISKDGGLDCMIEQEGKNLSGGQRQRLTIARALVKKPEILILDDSSSALDYATDAKLRKALKNQDYSPTVFIVAQRAASILHADQIIVLNDGKTVGIGTHENLLKSCEVYKEIYDSQFGMEG